MITSGSINGRYQENTMAKQMTDDVFWIGMDHPDNRNFHGIDAPRGGSYNSYLIKDEEPALVDGTNTNFLDKYMESLRSVIEPEKIRWIVINHAENDHAGAIKELLDFMPEAKIVCTKKCEEFIRQAYGVTGEFHIVGKEDELCIGKNTLKFYPEPMVHWPETMLTYLMDQKIIFSGDVFGTQVSHEGNFAEELQDFTEMSKDYYAMIFRPYHIQIKNTIEMVKTLDISYIMPTHGPSYKNPESIIKLYDELTYKPEKDKALIVYSTIWHGTEEIAKRISKRLSEEGLESEVFNIHDTNTISLMRKSLESKVLVFGSLTLISNYHPELDMLFGFIKHNHQKDKKTFIFGTYGWHPSSVENMKQSLADIGHDVLDTLAVRFRINDEDKNKDLDGFCTKIIEKLKGDKDGMQG